MTDPVVIKQAPNDYVDGYALVRRIAVYLCACVLSLLALQISVQAGEPVGETAAFKCVLVKTGDLQSTAPAGIADITVCHRPLHDDAFPVLHSSEPGPEEFEVFNDMVEEPAPAARPGWQEVVALIGFN